MKMTLPAPAGVTCEVMNIPAFPGMLGKSQKLCKIEDFGKHSLSFFVAIVLTTVSVTV
jgi:hypothetical protein